MPQRTSMDGWARRAVRLAFFVVQTAGVAALAGCGIEIVGGGAGPGGDPGPRETSGATGRGGAGGEVGVGGEAGAGGAGAAGGGATGTEVTGVCIVRDESTDLPPFGAPDVGSGYAKQAIVGVNDLEGLTVACTDDIYQVLIGKHCATSKTKVQLEIATYFPDGSWSATGCAAAGCEFVSCP